MSAFAAIANDVPRRIRTSVLFWILLALVALALLFFWASINVKPDPKTGVVTATWFGEDVRETTETGQFVNASADKMVPLLAGGVIGTFFACFVGVFAGLILLSDAITTAFGPGQAELNVPKPVHRGTIVLARHLGAVAVATFFATVLVGGGVLVTWLKTKMFVPQLFAYIPISVAMFGILHAVGAIAGVWIQNALIAVFGSVGALLVSFLSNIPNWRLLAQFEKGGYPLVEKIFKLVRIVHRVLPRPTDIPEFGTRLLEHKFGEDPIGVSGEVELIANALAWWGIALVLAVLVVRRRDF